MIFPQWMMFRDPPPVIFVNGSYRNLHQTGQLSWIPASIRYNFHPWLFFL